MILLKNLSDLKNIVPHEKRSLAITIGNFDGPHLGHKDLLERVQREAKSKNLAFAVLTFRPHPKSILFPTNDAFLISSYLEREKRLRDLGVEYLVELNFTRDFSTLTPDEFLKKFILSEKGGNGQTLVREIYFGHDFRFGQGKSGNYELVREKLMQNNVLAQQVAIYQLPAFFIKDQLISSSYIRNLLTAGKIEDANQLLVAPYALSGRVIKAKGLGKKIGFPTANMENVDFKLLPKKGVYLSKTRYKDDIYYSLTNLGENPTVTTEGSKEIKIETHLLCFDLDIYGENISVELLKYLREEIKFSDLDQLINQLKKDVKTAQEFFYDC